LSIVPGARIRRPLIALIALIIALVIGYSVRGIRSGDSHGGTAPPRPHPSVSSAPA
jgi:hypothetical protein